MSKKNKLKITISGYDVISTEEATKVITQHFFQSKRNFGGPIPLPTKRTLITVPISPHKHKDSQEQFERKIHRRLIEISNPTPTDWAKLDKLPIPHTVSVRIKESFSV